MFFKKVVLGFGFVISLYLNVMAQKHFITDDTIRIDEIVVTGSPVKVTRNNVPMAVSVVDRKAIEESGESSLLPLLNGRVPGLFVTERGVTGFGVAQGSAGQISIRGIGGSPTTGVLVLIDGHPQFMGIMGHPLPDSYITAGAERVEIIRGPASILYGTNAMGGVINIITRKQSAEGFHGNAGFSIGSFGTCKYMASGGLKNKKFSLYVSGNRDKTDGHRKNSEFDLNNGYLKLAYSFNPHLQATSDVSLTGFKASDPGPNTVKAVPGQKIDITRGYGSFSVLNEYEIMSGALKLFFNFGEHNITDGFHSTDNNLGVNFYESFKPFKYTHLTLGLDGVKFGGMAENVKAMNGKGVVFADTSVVETGIYGFVQQLISPKILLNAGLRWQNNSVYGDQWVPSAGFAYQLNSTTSWKGTFSEGFRSPTIRELYMWGQKNPNLKPEKVRSFETGIVKNWYDDRLSGEITLYAVNGDNLIVEVPQKGFQNTGSVSNKGAELVLNAGIFKNLKTNLTYSFIQMRTPVYATPKHHFYLDMSYRIGNFKITGDVRRISGLDNDPSPVVNLVQYTLMDLKAFYKIAGWLKVNAGIENLLNSKYEVNRYYSMPGITFWGGVSMGF